MRRRVALVLSAALLLAIPAPVSADDGPPALRRTSPRVIVAEDGSALLLSVPGGRAWGLESALMPLDGAPRAIGAALDVSDPAVKEAFIRVAYYRSTSGRPRQIAVADSQMVRAGAPAVATVRLDPPPGAVAYRVRVLARAVRAAIATAATPIRVVWRDIDVGSRVRPAYTRLQHGPP